MAEKKSKSLWDAKIIRRALFDAVVKLDPRTMMKNPVMFVVEVGSVVTTCCCSARSRVSRSICRSRFGSGLRCCSPTLPKPWRKDAAKRKRTRCARRDLKRRPTSAGERNNRDGLECEAAFRRCGDGRRRRIRFRETARSLRASLRWMNRPSPENRRRSFAKLAEIVRRLPAERACSLM